MEKYKVILELSKDEALVLSEFLHRCNASDKFDELIEHEAELRILWDLESSLEKKVDVFSTKYQENIMKARNNIIA